jgi:hypothetical protein
MEKYLLKIKVTQMIDVCKLTTIKIEDFDEVMLVVQVWSKEVWSFRCIIGWRVQCKYYLEKFKEET